MEAYDIIDEAKKIAADKRVDLDCALMALEIAALMELYKGLDNIDENLTAIESAIIRS